MVAELVDPAVIEQETATLSTSELAGYLQQVLGQRMVAYVCGLKDPKMVGQWANGKVMTPRSPGDIRLRQAYEAVRLISDAYGPDTAKSWLFGSNTRLDNEAPAYLLRYANSFDAMHLIVPTARAFAGGGSWLESVVWRLGWASTPFDFSPREYCSWQSRFDDVQRLYRSLYVARDKLTCLREVLADLRANTKALTDFQELFANEPFVIAGQVSAEFRQKRVLAPATIRILQGEFVDVDNVDVRTELEQRHASLLHEHGMNHLNIGEIRSDTRVVTQTISRSLYDQGAAGIVFHSRLDDCPCVALFESRANLIPAGDLEPLTDDVPELLRVCDEYNLVLRQPR
jgi:RES domain